MDELNTVDTTRINHDSAIVMAYETSRMQWPIIPMLKSPKVVILVPDSEFSYAYMAASLIHDPIMGTLLFNSPNGLNDITREEILRVDPQGVDDVPAVILVGPFRPKVAKEVENLGYNVLEIRGKNTFETAALVARFREEITPDSPEGPQSLFIVSADSPFEGMSVPYYSAHSGVPILLTNPGRLSPSIKKVLEEMSDKYVYVVGSKRAVSEKVVREISSIVSNPVRRIEGKDPYATAVEFAAYYDPETKLGWNRNKNGHGDAFTFTNIERWDLAMAAVAFAHQGKHTPLLLIGSESIPDSVLNYLEYLKPQLNSMHPMPPFMHGFILGSQDTISYESQSEIEIALKIDEQLK